MTLKNKIDKKYQAMEEKDILQRAFKIIRYFAKNADTDDLEKNKSTLLNELVKYVKALSDRES